MKQMFFWIAVSALFWSSIGCQSAYRISPDNWPKNLVDRTLALTTTDKAIHQLSDVYPKHRATALIFWQVGCPCVKRYQERVNSLFERFSQDGVAFIHVSSNVNEDFEDVEKEYKKRAVPLPLMRDQGGMLAKALGVKGTPSVALINQTGDVVYLGWIDNERHAKENGRIAYLENAIVELINQKPITIATSPMFGCPIR